MKIEILRQLEDNAERKAFTLIEVMMAISIVSFLFASLYLGFGQGFGIIQIARENLRATQILQERMETIRLYTWDQLNTAGFVPPTFTAAFYPVGTNANQGLIYQGTVVLTNATVTESYSSDLKMVL